MTRNHRDFSQVLRGLLCWVRGLLCYEQIHRAKERMVMQTLPSESLKLNFVLEQTDSGLSRASVLGLPDCQVEAATDEQAIVQLQQVIIQRLANARIVSLEIPLASSSLPLRRENPWTEFIGMFEGDAEFAAIAAELRAERDLDDGA